MGISQRRVAELKMAWVLGAALIFGGAPALAQAPSIGSFKLPPGQGSATPPGTLREGAGPPGGGVLSIQEQPGNALLVTEYLGRAVYEPGKQKVRVGRSQTCWST